ncbi:MAG: glycosyltransferase family 4 protein [Candidatus Dormibacteria bacterium]
MKVCLVSPYDFMHPGGVTEHVRHLAATLRRRGHQVTILAPSSIVGDDHGISGYIRIGRSVPVRSNGSVARIALSFHLVRRVRSLLNEEDFDIVHYHEPLVPALPITVLRFHRGANVATFHAMARRNLGYYYARPFLRRYFRRLHSCIAVSTPARGFIGRYFQGDYRVIPNGIDVSRFNPSRPPMEGLRTPGRQTILHVGRLEKRKGFMGLLKAYAELRTRRSEPRLVVVGDGPMREEYEEYVRDHQIPDVLFCGHVEADLLPRYYTAADVFCAPATGGESFGIVLLEAMASGVPVVASAIAGFGEVVAAGTDGLLLPPRQPRAWSAELERLLDDPARRRSLADAGLLKAQAFAWERVADSILDVYRQARSRSRDNLVAAGVHQQVPGMG